MRNSLFGTAARAVAGFARIGVFLAIASRYGPAQFGRVSLAITVMEIFRSFSECGLDTVALRNLSQLRNRSACSALLSRIVTLKLVAAALFYALALVVIKLLARDRSEIVLGAIASISLFSSNLVGAYISYHQSQLKMPAVFPCTIFAYGIYTIVAIGAIHSGSPLWLVLALLPMVEALYSRTLMIKADMLSELRCDFSGASSLIKESLPLGIMSATIFLYLRLDNMLIFKFLGSAALGLYAASVRIIEPTLMVPGAFSTTLLSVMSARGAERVGRRQLASIVWQTMWPAYAFTGCVTASLLLGGEHLLLLFGPAYLAAYQSLRILSFCLLVRTVNITVTALINARGDYYLLARITTVNLLINFGLVILLLPRYGLAGAAMGALGTECWNMAAQAWYLFGTPGNPLSYGSDLVSLEPQCE